MQTATINNDCVMQVGHDSTVVNCDIATADRGGVSKILGLNTDACTLSIETVQGRATVCGRVNYRLLYLDAEGRMAGLDYYAEWQQMVSDDRIGTAEATARVAVVDTEYRTISGTIKLQATVEIALYQAVTYTDTAVTDAECEELRDTIDTVLLSPLTPQQWEVVEEVDSGVGIERILLFEAKVLYTQCRMGEVTAQVMGQAAAQVVYVTTDGRTVYRNIDIPWAQEMDVTDEVQLDVTLKSSRLVLTGDENNNVLRIELMLVATGYRAAHTDVEVVVEAYDDNCCLQPVRQAASCYRPLCRVAHTEHLNTPVDAHYNMPTIRTLISGLIQRVNVGRWYAQEGCVVAEGVVLAALLYTTDEDEVQSAEVQIPFSIPIAQEGVSAEDMVQGDAIVTGLDAVLRGQSVDITMHLTIAAEVAHRSTIRYVQQYACTEWSPSHDQAVISVYFATPKDSIWDIARQVRMAPSALMQLNPDLGSPTTAPRRVVVFRHRDLQ